MSTAEELSAAVRQVAAHETHVATLTVRINEMRDDLDQAGVRLHTAETQDRAGMKAGGYVKFTLGEEMMFDNFKGTDREKFSDCEFQMSNFEGAWRLPHRRHLGVDHTTAGRCARGQLRRDRTPAGMGRTSKRPHEVCEVLVFTVLSNRKDGTPHRFVRHGRHKDGVKAWRRLHMEYAPATSATAHEFMKKSQEIPPAKNTSDVSSAIQMLEKL